MKTIVVKDRLELKKIIKNSPLDADLNHLDVSNITSLKSVFTKSKFNGDISAWDVSNVKDMYRMFAESQFTGDISEWDVSDVVVTDNSMFDDHEGRKGMHKAVD